MARQLVLLDSTSTDWRLDEATRTAGKRGVAAARAALAALPPAGPDGDGHDRHMPAA